MDESLSKLIAFLSDVSPMIWTALLRQVAIEAWAKIGWGLFLIILSTFMVGVIRRYPGDDWMKDLDPTYFVLALLSVAGVLVAGFLFTTAVMALINPEYYAIQLILHSLIK